MMNKARNQDIPQWDVADRLHKSLRVTGLSVQDMADELEVHRNTVSAWLNGRSRPKKTQLIAWALKTGLPYEWLAHGDGMEPGTDPDRALLHALAAALLPRLDSNQQPADYKPDNGGVNYVGGGWYRNGYGNNVAVLAA